MGVMRCHHRGCMRQVDLDSHLEDWDDEADMCRWCAEAENEELLRQQAAQSAEDGHGA